MLTQALLQIPQKLRRVNADRPMRGNFWRARSPEIGTEAHGKKEVLHRHENGSDMNIVGLDRFFTRQSVAFTGRLRTKGRAPQSARRFCSCWPRSKSNSGQIS